MRCLFLLKKLLLEDALEEVLDASEEEEKSLRHLLKEGHLRSRSICAGFVGAGSIGTGISCTGIICTGVATLREPCIVVISRAVVVEAAVAVAEVNLTVGGDKKVGSLKKRSVFPRAAVGEDYAAEACGNGCIVVTIIAKFHRNAGEITSIKACGIPVVDVNVAPACIILNVNDYVLGGVFGRNGGNVVVDVSPLVCLVVEERAILGNYKVGGLSAAAVVEYNRVADLSSI